MAVDRIETIVKEGIAAGAFPGAVVLVERAGRRVCSIARGGRQTSPTREPMTRDTLFDLASLTKPLSTAVLVLLISHEQGIDLASHLARFIPEVHPETGAVSLLELLLHTGGLPPVPDLYRSFPRPADADREKAERLLLAIAPDRPPGREVVYSCTGYQLLGLFIRRVTGRRPGDLFRTAVAEPCGLADLLFNPPAEARRRVAATEHCAWRGRWIRGEVHDENAWCLGGDAGNAGLFGTAAAVLRLLAMFINGRAGDVDLLPEHLVRLTRTCLTEGLGRRRAVGFMMHDAEAPVGPRYGGDSFGHTGFTGTSVWIDPKRDLKVVALTNRVHLGRTPTEAPLKDFRLHLHQAVLDEVG